MPAIAEHALLGDCKSAALVDLAGAVDWLCWPRFDSPAIFAAILDPERGGVFRVGPVGATRARRRYLDDTNVLETTFESSRGTVVLTDAMAAVDEAERRRGLTPEQELLRALRCEAGAVEVEVVFDPRPDFGRRGARLHDRGSLGIHLDTGQGHLALVCDRPLQIGEGGARGRFVLRAGERLHASLVFDAEGPAVVPPAGRMTWDRIEHTAAFWRRFASRVRYDGPFRDAVVRSLLALKLMVFAPSGAIVAAPTTSLPERPGGDLNWDYRFCWLRDAAFTTRVLCDLGYEEDAIGFVSWLLHTTHLRKPHLSPLYDVYGRPAARERDLDHLAGFGGARPVRIGNAAAGQLQLDVAGELVDAAALLISRGLPVDRDASRLLRQLGEDVARRWREPDAGIWEVRGEPRHHTHSRVLSWVAFDRLCKLVAGGVFDGPLEAWREARDAIRLEVMNRGFSEKKCAFTRTLDGDDLDAATLLFAKNGFEAPDSPRMRGTLAAVDRELGCGGGLIRRYLGADSPGEGAFVACSFWAAELAARGAEPFEDALRRFAALLAYRNDVGLYAEEVHPTTGALLGNFPQAYSHVGLLSAALALAERAEREATVPSAEEWPPAPEEWLPA